MESTRTVPGSATEGPALPYAADNRESQIAVMGQLRRRRREGRELIPKSLLNAADAMKTVNLPEELKSLSRAEYKSPVASLYLALTPDKVAPEQKALVRAFRSMKSLEIDKRKDFIEALPKAQKEMLTSDLEEIDAFLTNYYVPSDAHSLIILKSGEDLNRVIALQVRVADRLTIDPDPYTLPLEAAIEEHEKVLLLEITKGESIIKIYHLGNVFTADTIRSFVPHHMDTSALDAQRHVLTHLEWHLKATAQRASRLYNEESCQALIVMGDEEIFHLFETYLPEALQHRIIGRIHGSPAADTRNREELIETALREHRTAEEAAAMREVQEHTPREEVVSGLQEVVEALNLFFVRRLLVSASLRRKGFACQEHHFVSLDQGQCPFCGEQLLPFENIVDEIVEIARVHGVNLTIVEYREDLLTAYQGIAAILYPQISRAALAST
jgi:predicted Zn-ribbon and HTH transcriptional regulator